MPARLWLVLLCALALAALPAHSAAAQSGVPEASATDHGWPTIETDHSPYSADVRAAEGAEALTVVARVLATGAALPPAVARRAAWALAPATHAARWCDVVQCRRLTGAQLLRYATPPPARN